MERGSASVVILNLIKNFAKYLAVYVCVIIVLSEAIPRLVFCEDGGQEIVWVTDKEEVEEWARKLHLGVSDAELKLHFDKAGKLPLKILHSMTALKKYQRLR